MHHIVPQTVKSQCGVIRRNHSGGTQANYLVDGKSESLSKKEREKLIRTLEKEMRDAARHLEFERAAQLRDAIIELTVSGDGSLTR